MQTVELDMAALERRIVEDIVNDKFPFRELQLEHYARACLNGFLHRTMNSHVPEGSREAA